MQGSHNNQKKIAVINDYSGFGRCSIAVAMPIISVMKVQCCPVPTSIFSNHTGFDSFYYEDFTDHMQRYIDEWKKLDLQFSGVCTGFLGSSEQISIVERFLTDFKRPETKVIVDPVMGDYGKPYPTYTDELCQQMKKLVRFADILTPNTTEACVLTDTPYKDGWHMDELKAMAEKLAAQSESRQAKVVITGIRRGSFRLPPLAGELRARSPPMLLRVWRFIGMRAIISSRWTKLRDAGPTRSCCSPRAAWGSAQRPVGQGCSTRWSP